MAFRGAAFRAAFLATRCFGATFLVMAFRAGLLFKETFAFAVFRETAFWATALFAFGRFFATTARRLAADLGEDRRAAARDVERLKPFVTALMKASN
jgi:hypothetical protein